MRKGLLAAVAALFVVEVLVVAAAAIAQPSSKQVAVASPACKAAGIGYAGP